MGLKAVYEKFLTSPNPLGLSEGAVLQYVTTLTTFTEQGPIIRHLETQNKNVVKKRSEKIISEIEGLTSVAVITETTLEFISSGGAYLPNLDNFIVDRVVTFPIVSLTSASQVSTNLDRLISSTSTRTTRSRTSASAGIKPIS